MKIDHWLGRMISNGSFACKRDVVRFALRNTILTTFCAVGLNFVVYKVLGSIAMLGITPPANLLGDMIVTATVASSLSFFAYYIVGGAILRLSISHGEMQRLSRTDPLTGLLNRRAFVESVEPITRPYALVVLDIDHFKHVNDRHGHPAGDEVLVRMAEVLTEAGGESRPVARLGGEEFGIMIIDEDYRSLMEYAEAIRAKVSEMVIAIGDVEIGVTISAGISHRRRGESYSSVLNRADKALYVAKASGRNRVVHSDDIRDIVRESQEFDEPLPLIKERKAG